MESNWKKKARSALLVASLALLPGCIAAGAAAAGAGTGVYLTTRGAESIVDGSIDDVERRARAVFEAENIPISGTQTENSGDKRELKGKKDDLDITVSMERQNPQTTKVEVSARRNLVTWDKDYAQQLLGKIVKQK
jgi:peroxiredoxin family protein